MTFVVVSPKLDASSVIMTAGARQTAPPKLPPKKGSEIYRAQDNFRGDWRLYNAVIYVLDEKGVGFRNGAELTAGKELVGVLTDVFFEILPKERLERLESRSFRLPSLFNPLLGPAYNDPARNGHKRLPQLSHADLTRMSEAFACEGSAKSANESVEQCVHCDWGSCWRPCKVLQVLGQLCTAGERDAPPNGASSSAEER